MYKRLSENETKSNYRLILCETLALIEKQKEGMPISLCEDIYEQLLDIKESVIDRQIYTSEDDIDERYTLGGIAVKDFDDGDEMQERLCDIFGGASEYNLYPDD